MKALMLSLLLIVSLAGCQSTTVEQDPGERMLPEGTVATIHTALAPEIVPYARTISVWTVDWIPDVVVQASGAYIPFTKTVIVSGESTDPHGTLIHEILHVIAWKGRIPHQEEFAENLEKFLADKNYSELVSFTNKKWAEYMQSWLYPSFMREDEYYAYLGSALFSREDYGDTGLPPYMAKHFRGILHPLLYTDQRQYGGMTLPDWSRITVTYLLHGKLCVLQTSWPNFEALFRYGGVLRPVVTLPGVVPVVLEKVYTQVPDFRDGIVVPEGVTPLQVAFALKVGANDWGTLSCEPYTVLTGSDSPNGAAIFRHEIIHPRAGERKYVALEADAAFRLYRAYINGSLEIRLTAVNLTQVGRH